MLTLLLTIALRLAWTCSKAVLVAIAVGVVTSQLVVRPGTAVGCGIVAGVVTLMMDLIEERR